MAQISKKLPIRQHDSKAERGAPRMSERLARAGEAALGRPRPTDAPARAQMRALLSSAAQRERDKGARQLDAAVRQRRAVRENRKLAREAMRDPLAKMKYDTQLATQKFAHDLRRSKIVAAGQPKGPARCEAQAAGISALHRAHVDLALVTAMKPLRNGVSAKSVAQVMGTMVGMYAFSPNVRQVMNESLNKFLPDLRGAVKSKVVDKVAKTKVGKGLQAGLAKSPGARRLDAKALDKLDAAEARGGGRDSLAQKWQRRLDLMQSMKPGDREPHTVQSAAMVRIGLAESAYAAMRDPSIPADKRDEHVNDVMDSYDSANSVLNDFMVEDELSKEEVEQAVRMMVGARLEREPHLAAVFNELSHGRFVKSEPRMATVIGKSEPVAVWDGAFTDAVTDQEVNAGSFSVRPPMPKSGHLEMCTQTLAAEIEDATSLEQLNEIYDSYAASSVVRQYPDMIDDVTDPTVRKRMGRASSMFASMRADGISQSDQRFIYAASFTDAMERLSETKPELMEQWEAQHGRDWRDHVQNVVKTYSDIGATAEDRELVESLVARGFAEEEAFAEVEALRAEHEADPDAGPMLGDPLPVQVEPGQVPAPGEFSMHLPEHSSVPINVVLVDRMSDWMAADMRHETDKAGWYEPGSIERTDPMNRAASHIDAPTMLRSTMASYADMGAVTTLGHEARDRGVEPGSDVERRQIQFSRMQQALHEAGLSEAEQDAAMAAAYASALEKVVADEPFQQLAVEEAFGVDMRESDWREAVYTKSIEDMTGHRQQGHPDHRPTRMQWSDWERRLDALDDVRVIQVIRTLPTSGVGREQVAQAVEHVQEQVVERRSETAHPEASMRTWREARQARRAAREQAAQFGPEQSESQGPELS